MKKLIVAAALAVVSFAALVHTAPAARVAEGKAAAAHVSTGRAPALDSVGTVATDRDVLDFDSFSAQPTVFAVPEITIVGIVPVAHRAETDAEHIARLMAKPLRCTEMHDAAWSTESNAAGQVGGNGRVASCL